MNKKLEMIDFLRGFAIFTIALMHLIQGNLSGAVYKAASFGGAGVHVFILVSGFGLYLSYMRKQLGYSDFLKKRFGKVYWPYAIMVVGWLLWFLVSSGSLLWREGLSHLLLYKMFDAELDVSLCYPYWFISTIIQFYICWPLIVRVARLGEAKISFKGVTAALAISVIWWVLVGFLGFEDKRPWGSCFLQFLWEFVLGMWLAERYAEDSSNKVKSILEAPEKIRLIYLILSASAGMALTGLMAWNGGALKLFNDIPSLVGYLSILLIIYKMGCNSKVFAWVKELFSWASSFGYELYLVHSLVYCIVGILIKNLVPLPILIVVSFVLAYVVAWGYSLLLKRIRGN